MKSSVPYSLPFHQVAAAVPPAALAVVLEEVDELPATSTGALRFGERGCIFLESGRICWAAAGGMKNRLTDILRHHSDPPVARDAMERVVEQCASTTTPIGEALVAARVVTVPQLRAAIRQHTVEAISLLATAGPSTGFTPHITGRYDARFTFSSAEVLASVGALRAPATARRARRELDDILVERVGAVSFLRDPGTAGAVPVTTHDGQQFRIRELVALCDWAMSVLDVSSTLTNGLRLATASWSSGAALVAWRREEIGFIAVCERPALVRLLARLGGAAR